MNQPFLGAGNSTGMFYKAPEGTALPSYPGETLAAAWELVGDVAEDGISLKLPSGDVIRNWALQPKRRVNTENGAVTVPILDTTKKVFETLFGADNSIYEAATSSHGNLSGATMGPDATSAPAAYLFLMKDGNALAYVGTSSGLITQIDDVPLKAGDAAIWNAQIDGTWTFLVDDGEVTS